MGVKTESLRTALAEAEGELYSALVMKWLKRLLGLLLLPFCLGAAVTLFQIISATGKADTVWIALIAGATCWLVICLLLPKPMLTYVFGHEITHVLWTWLFLGKVTKFRSTAKGGQVTVSKSNFLISLAPYFFPFYTFMTVMVFVIGNLIWDWRRQEPWFHLLVGFTYAFHLSMTLSVLRVSQPDVKEHGYFFSGVIIFLGNVLTLMMGLPLLTGKVGILTAVNWWIENSARLLLEFARIMK